VKVEPYRDAVERNAAVIRQYYEGSGRPVLDYLTALLLARVPVEGLKGSVVRISGRAV